MLNAFGFFYCRIKTKNLYLGLLPVRKDLGIIMPNGEWEGWYLIEELRFAQENGYKIFVINGYHFDKVYNVFDGYVRDFYKIKSTSDSEVEKDVAKRMLNHLLGRFGLHIFKPVTELIETAKFNEISQTKRISSFVIVEDKYLVTYDNQISKDICDQFNVDYKGSVVNNIKANQETEHTFKDVSIAIASAVTSYARIFISKAKLDVLARGGKLYYTDTDSIVSDIPLPVSMVGGELGQFKLVHIVSKGYFITSKTYCTT